MATPAEAVAILDKLVEELRKRQTDVETYTDAYNGCFKLHYASDDFSEFFGRRYEKFSDNWTQVVADAPHERLEPIGIRLRDAEKGDKSLWGTWLDNDADALADLAMLDAIRCKRAFGLVWGDEDDRGRITWEHPSQAIVGYDPETRARVAGAKVWSDDDREFATLYLPDEVWKFQRDRVSNGQRPSGLYVPHMDGGWEPRQPETDDTWPLPNPLGKVALVELPNRPQLVGEPLSDIAGTLSMQHAINLVWSQLFLAVDNASWPARVIMGMEKPTIPVLDENGQEVGEREIDLKKFALNKATWLEDPNAKISEWSAANLEGFTKIIDKAVGHIAAQTRTPAHYLLVGGTIANVSGDALKAVETGLVKRTQEKTEHFGRGIRDVFELVALAEGDEAKATAVRGGKVLWKDVENRSDAQLADALSKKKDIGYPLRYLLELDGLPPSEIERVMAMKDEEDRSMDLIEKALRPLNDPNKPAATEE